LHSSGDHVGSLNVEFRPVPELGGRSGAAEGLNTVPPGPDTLQQPRLPRAHADFRSSTETSGSSQNAQTAAPKMRSPAATMNGACQEPN